VLFILILHVQSIKEWVDDIMPKFPGITRAHLLQDLQNCYKNRRKNAPSDTRRRGSKGRRKNQRQEDGGGENTAGPLTPPTTEQARPEGLVTRARPGRPSTSDREA
jgi:hypothetical protein